MSKIKNFYKINSGLNQQGKQFFIYSIVAINFAQDWTLICMWLTLVFTVVYFLFGDFFTENYEDVIEEDNGKTDQEQDSE